MKKPKLLMALCSLLMGGVISVSAQASYNQDYTQGVTVNAGGDYFLYNIGAKKFLTDGRDYGTRGTADNAGRTITLTASGESYTIYTKTFVTNDKAGYVIKGHNGPYVDGASNNAQALTFTSKELSGYTNVYTIKMSDNEYLCYDNTNTSLNISSYSDDNNFYWLLIPITARQSAKDYSYLLQNTDFNRPWERFIWSDESKFDTSNNTFPNQKSGGNADNPCSEIYRKAFDASQTISGDVLANGKYKLYNQGFYRKDGGNDPAYIYANEDKAPLSVLNANGEGTTESMTGASTAFSKGQYVNSVTTIVTNNSLKIGVKNDNTMNWVIFDNFYLEYLGTTLINDGTALPEDGTMDADKWYYFEISATGKYNLTITNADDVTYVKDNGEMLTADANSTATAFSSTDNVELSSGRYYVKSTSANNLSIAVAAYAYNVGAATTSINNGEFIKELTSFTIAFNSAETNDTEAKLSLLDSNAKVVLKKDAASVAEGTISFDDKTLTATFTDVTLELGATYTLTLQSGVVGFNNAATNSEVSISFNTPVIADGIYYFYNTYTKTYMSRGNTWGTQAIVDNYGLPAYVNFNTDGTTKVQFFDNLLYLSDGGWLYADNGTGGNFMIEATTGGYKLKDKTSGKYVAVYENQIVGDAVEGDNLQGTSNIWSLETVAQYKEKDNATTLANAQAAAIGIEDVMTMAALEAHLSSNYGETEVAITGAKGEKFEKNAWGDGNNSGALVENKYVTETVENLEPGIYRLSVDAFQRAASNDRVAAAGGARSLIYVYANGAKTQLKSVMDFGADDAYSKDFEYDGKHYPDNLTSAYAALETGNYRNNVYVKVDADEGSETGSLTFGINNPQNAASNAIWCAYDNFTLVRFEAKPTDAEKNALTSAIEAAESKTLGFENGEYAPYNNVEAIKAMADAKAIDLTTASAAVVTAATATLTAADWKANTEEVSAIDLVATCDESNVDADNRIFAPGWGKAGGTDAYNTRLIKGSNGNAGMTAVTGEVALFTKFATTYGEETGYTMPLKGNTVYKLSFKYGAWGENKEIVSRLAVTDAENNAIEVVPGSFTRANNSGLANESTEAWFDYEGFFKTDKEGNYVLSLTKDNNAEQRQIVMGDLVLKKAVAENIEISEDETYVPAVKYANVTFKRTLPEGWSGLVLPFDMTVADVKTAFSATDVKDFSGITYDETNGVTLNFSDAQEVKAGRPFMVKASAGTSYTINGVILPAASLTDVEQKATDNENIKYTFTGTYAQKTDLTDVTFALINGGKFYYHTAGVNASSAKAFRAYFANNSAEESSEVELGSRLSFNLDNDVVTAISEIAAQPNGNDAVYNLGGQRVTKAQKGLYIQNGKKVVVK